MKGFEKYENMTVEDLSSVTKKELEEVCIQLGCNPGSNKVEIFQIIKKALSKSKKEVPESIYFSNFYTSPFGIFEAGSLVPVEKSNIPLETVQSLIDTGICVASN